MNKVTLLPLSLAEHIHTIDFPKGKYDFKNKAILLLKLLYSHFIENGKEFMPLSKEYLVKAFGRAYHKLIKFLLEQKIILAYTFNTVKGDKAYSTRNHQSKRYCINPDLLTSKDDFKIVHFQEKEKEPTEPCIYADWSLSDLKRIDFDYEGAKQWIRSYIDKISIDDFPINEKITEEIINLKINDKQVFLKRSEAILKANNENKDLIEVSRNEFVIQDRKKFIDKKKKDINNYYQYVITKLKNKIFYAKRNFVNTRLDTNITSLPSELIDFITVDGERLVNIDISNSQFVFLAWKLKTLLFVDAFDLYEFIDLSKKGILYNESARLLFNITGEVSEEQRKKAKGIWFQVAFSSYKYSSPQKKKLENIFPSIFQIIKDYKKKHGDNQFSIMLQKTESSVCIDRIYKSIKEQGHFCLTKHDSFLVKESQVNTVESIIREELNVIDMVCDLKVDYETKIKKPKELTDMEQFILDNW